MSQISFSDAEYAGKRKIERIRTHLGLQARAPPRAAKCNTLRGLGR